jgi:hypothetical protein
MRRRPQQTPASTSSEVESGLASTEKIGSSSSTNENIMSKSLRNTPMTVATTFEVDSGNSATESRSNKPFSLCPRNYSGRRQLIATGCFFLLIIIIALQVNKSNDNGKKRKSKGKGKYTSISSIVCCYEYIRIQCVVVNSYMKFSIIVHRPN